MQPALRQPIGFWTVRCGEAVVARTRAALAEMGISQPEWWVLHQLSMHPHGVARSELIDTIGPNASPEVIADAISRAADKQWLTADGSKLSSTTAGVDTLAKAAALQEMLELERRQGISDEDYETTISVLQRTIANVGGEAWHW